MAPVNFGSNTMSTLAFWPGFNVSGSDGPVHVKLADDGVKPEITRFAVPAFETVMGKVTKLPKTTLPKLIDVGEVEIVGPPDDSPAPVSATDTGVELELFVIDRVPVAFPVAVGLNVIVTEAFSPAWMVAGTVMFE
jgi:hypothetical protein